VIPPLAQFRPIFTFAELGQFTFQKMLFSFEPCRMMPFAVNSETP
jgi:hypothetical protein